MPHAINRDLLQELEKLGEGQQEKVLTFTREMLTSEEMDRRANLSEEAISGGKVKSFGQFDRGFEEWMAQKKKNDTK
ncbi:MAG: hypothetical protein RIE86_23270 [Imperialibacter sp.]|uniref:hypothetical protein n=1 Tax=Imperialibacter sp. TaxID=2038411 RepID=UPI0032EDB7DD